MPKLCAQIPDILVHAPDRVYAEISSNDIAGRRDPVSLADDVFKFANCLLEHGVRTVVLGQVFFRDSANSRYSTIADFNDRVVVYNIRMVDLCASSDAIIFWVTAEYGEAGVNICSMEYISLARATESFSTAYAVR